MKLLSIAIPCYNSESYMEKCNLVAYSHGRYFTLGEELGKFGYSVKKKK